MPEYPQPINEPFSEKLRVIRFRMMKEKFRFADEIRLVPRWLVALVIVLFVLAQAIAFTISLNRIEDNAQPLLIVAAIVTAVAIPVACVLFLIGYVNHDAKRRGMNATLWTLLVIILLPAYLATGFIIYFLVREPLPYNCPQCRSTVRARFNYCPHCKCNLRPTCHQCKREVDDGDRYCPHCGSDLAASASSEPAAPKAD